MSRSRFRSVTALAVGLMATVVLVTPDNADAQRRGSFGSRGARTYTRPPVTTVAPKPTAPVQRSMTERPAPGASAQAGQAGRNAAGRPAGLGRGLIGGLIAGGLIGALLGGGLGSLAGAGMLMALLQVVLIGGLAWFLFRMFRRKPAFAGVPGQRERSPFSGMAPQPMAGQVVRPARTETAVTPLDQDIAIDTADRSAFERLLIDVKDAFGREDYAQLRELTTPEIMSYFAEELGQNATNGRRNEIADAELLDAEVAEAWQEGAIDYATIAMRYQSIDVIRDRSTGAVVDGDPARPTSTTELWTFKRGSDGRWRLSAIQDA